MRYAYLYLRLCDFPDEEDDDLLSEPRDALLEELLLPREAELTDLLPDVFREEKVPDVRALDAEGDLLLIF